ncbi:MAG: hypothetical protein ACOH10_15060, partial [Rhodoglobus sp.]
GPRSPRAGPFGLPRQQNGRAMAAYFLSSSLSTLRGQVNSLWPGRDKASDGWIGDTSHAARASDHNPDADGSVNAFDFDKDGIDTGALIRAAQSDRRTGYVIWSGRIWTPAGGWRAYVGANGHYHHVHISIKHGDTYEDDTTRWALATSVSNVISSSSVLGTTAAPAPVPLIPIRKAPTMIVIRGFANPKVYIYNGSTKRHLTNADAVTEHLAALLQTEIAVWGQYNVDRIPETPNV